MTAILGINGPYHELAACLVKDGEIVAAAEEERFNRIKHSKESRVDNPDMLPLDAISFCLSEAKMKLRDVDYIGYSLLPEKRLDKMRMCDKLETVGWGNQAGEELFYKKIVQVPGNLSHLAGSGISKKFIWLEHHLCHAASAYLPSPFAESAILSVDGIGENTTSYLGRGRGNEIEGLAEICYPNSLGFLWEKLSKFLGFSEYDVYKVMGLSAYGSPTCKEEFDQIITKGERGHFAVNNDILKFRTEDYGELKRLFGIKRRGKNGEIGGRHADIASSLQKATEEIMLHMCEFLKEETNSENLCLGGGVALNCLANFRIQSESGFKRIYIQPAANDAGTAIGSALYIWNILLKNKKRFHMRSPYLGPKFSNAEIWKVLGKEKKVTYAKIENIERETAKILSNGQIVGWFQGRMEIGPRALGNRSLLADPRRADMKDIINMKIKHREEFRPFAPSVLEEEAENWFGIPKNAEAKEPGQMMLITYPALRNNIPAVVHKDGTSRIQVVSKKINPKYHKLIQEFRELTGVPLLLNTSFNNQEPIVCSPQDALNTFLKTDIDYLAMGDYLIKKRVD
ncbi:MAG: carbamoyltransferase C-terminal domain-containing protein [Candidatus Diapherotrites archaeon]